MATKRPQGRGWVRARRAVWLAGLALSVVQVFRAQVSMDQFYALTRGWLFAAEGWWVPFGPHTSAGGFAPGGLVSLLTGVPLWFWRDYRAAGAFVVVGHLVAWWLIDRACRDALGPRGRFLLALLWWLNPWRLHHSAFVWNPNWMFLVGAVHLASARRLAREPRFLASCVHVAAIGLAVQLHSSFLVVAAASLALVLRRTIRLHGGGAVVGAAGAAATLVPWIALAASHPEILPLGGHGFLGRGVVLVFPLVRGVGYLIRYPSLALGRQATRFDFSPAMGDAADAVLAPLADGLAAVAGVATAVVALMAFVRLWRRAPRPWFGPTPPGASSRAWLTAYVRWTLIGAIAAFAAAPTTIMLWQGFVAFHAAVLVTVLWGEAVLRVPRRRDVARRAAALWTAASLVLATALAFASPMYRRGGRQACRVVVSAPVPFLDALGVSTHATVEYVETGGWESRLLLGRDRWDDVPPSERRKM